MRERTNRVLSGMALALAVAVVAAAVAVGRHRPTPGGGLTKTSTSSTSKSTSPSPTVPPDIGGDVGNAFIDKTPPPDDVGASRVDFRSYRYTRDQAVRLFQSRVERDPKDFVSRALLGEAYALKARESGDLASFERAEDALRKSLDLLPGYTRARVALAQVLCDRHKFGEALDLAGLTFHENPGNLYALATLGDAQLGLGRYEEAEATYQKLLSRNTEPSTLARMAHIEELKGRTEEALDLLRRAALAEQKAAETQSAAWYEVRLGEISFDAGRLDDAETAYRAVLTSFPDHHEATWNLAKVRAARGHYDEAIALLEKAMAGAPEPSLLATLGELYVKNGQDERARQVFERLEQTAQRFPEYRRELVLFYAQHDRQLSRAVELAQEDLLTRGDIYGYDALAWALYKDGRPEEAAKAMAQALKLGTRDARLFYHAGLIDNRLGDRNSARTWLGRALALNPHFSVLDAEVARRTLAELH